MQDRWLTDWDFNPRFPFLTRANAGEVLPDPVSPLGWTLGFEEGLLPGWLRAGYLRLIDPVAEALVRWRVSPNTITTVGTLSYMTGGVIYATGG